jgi:FMN phosphatase YigB (HAD superfamily)
MTADKLGVKPEECAFVGDMFSRDVYGAHLAGMMPIWIWPHGDRDCRLPEVTQIHRLAELLDLFKG